MLMHLLKLKLVSLDDVVFNSHNFFDLECAALVKDGKVYGIGTEDMDVCTILFFLVLVVSLFI